MTRCKLEENLYRCNYAVNNTIFRRTNKTVVFVLKSWLQRVSQQKGKTQFFEIYASKIPNFVANKPKHILFAMKVKAAYFAMKNPKHVLGKIKVWIAPCSPPIEFARLSLPLPYTVFAPTLFEFDPSDIQMSWFVTKALAECVKCYVCDNHFEFRQLCEPAWELGWRNQLNTPRGIWGYQK